MDWFAPVDNYCERLDATLWAEPLNALSNASFLIAGLLLLRQWQSASPRHAAALALVINVLLMGLGSIVFHTIATRWSALADVLPIAVFIHL